MGSIQKLIFLKILMLTNIGRHRSDLGYSGAMCPRTATAGIERVFTIAHRGLGKID